MVLNIILVALDSSALSEQVIQTLEALQLKSATKAILAHVIAPQDSGMETDVERPHTNRDEFLYRQIEKQLQAYQERLPCLSELEIVGGDPAEEIIRLANIYSADLIVLGNRGLTGVKRILEGSVSSQVVEDAPCSVLVVKS